MLENSKIADSSALPDGVPADGMESTLMQQLAAYAWHRATCSFYSNIDRCSCGLSELLSAAYKLVSRAARSEGAPTACPRLGSCFSHNCTYHPALVEPAPLPTFVLNRMVRELESVLAFEAIPFKTGGQHHNGPRRVSPHLEQADAVRLLNLLKGLSRVPVSLEEDING